MVLYLSIIGISMVIISTLNIAFCLNQLNTTAWMVILLVCLGVCIQFVIDGLFAILINKLPNKWFGINKRIFNVPKFERKFLESLKIRTWKDKVWELGGMGGFSKKTLVDPNNKEYIELFLIECNKGVVVHWLGMVLGFSLILIFPLKFALTISLPIAIVNMVLNIMSTMVLRYNTPKLMVVYKKLSR